MNKNSLLMLFDLFICVIFLLFVICLMCVASVQAQETLSITGTEPVEVTLCQEKWEHDFDCTWDNVGGILCAAPGKAPITEIPCTPEKVYPVAKVVTGLEKDRVYSAVSMLKEVRFVLNVPGRKFHFANVTIGTE